MGRPSLRQITRSLSSPKSVVQNHKEPSSSSRTLSGIRLKICKTLSRKTLSPLSCNWLSLNQQSKSWTFNSFKSRRMTSFNIHSQTLRENSVNRWVSRKESLAAATKASAAWSSSIFSANCVNNILESACFAENYRGLRLGRL